MCYFEKRLDACRVSGGRTAEQEAGQDSVGVAVLAGEDESAAVVGTGLLAPTSGFSGHCQLLWKRARAGP